MCRAQNVNNKESKTSYLISYFLNLIALITCKMNNFKESGEAAHLITELEKVTNRQMISASLFYVRFLYFIINILDRITFAFKRIC